MAVLKITKQFVSYNSDHIKFFPSRGRDFESALGPSRMKPSPGLGSSTSMSPSM